MYASDAAGEELERTAFRKAEKKYKLYYDNSRRKKVPMPVDLSEVVDFKAILENYTRNGELPGGVLLLNSGFDRHVFCLEDRPGFYFVPGALSVEEQCHWIKESLISFPQPPNRTNHNAIYGPIEDLFTSATTGKDLVFEEKARDCAHVETDIGLSSPEWKIVGDLDVSNGKVLRKSASVMLRKLRWSTLGLQFDWSKRSYNTSLPHNKIPDALCLLAQRMAAPAMRHGDQFKPEAAIVNYFGPGDTLGGHLDDMEKDWSKPIVSMSLGCKAIFLLGGKSRVYPPTAMFLRSGDIVLMAGEARECFHGVPRIFTDEEHAEITHLKSRFVGEDVCPFLNYMRTSRININIRHIQVETICQLPGSKAFAHMHFEIKPTQSALLTPDPQGGEKIIKWPSSRMRMLEPGTHHNQHRQSPVLDLLARLGIQH